MCDKSSCSRLRHNLSAVVLRSCGPLLRAGLLALLSYGTANAQDASHGASLRAGRIADDARAPTIDGRLDEGIWSSVEPSSTFTQQYPNDGAPASERTELRILFDRRTVYVGIVCFDSDPSQIMVTQSRRDGDLHDGDSIQIVFDTFNDQQNGFVFGTNPMGIEYDGQLAAEGGTGYSFNANWDADWSVRSSITARGWETEIAIPLRTLRYRTGSDQSWGVNVMRIIRRKNEQVFLAPIPRGYSLYRVSLAAQLTGLVLPPRRDLKVIPFVLGSADKDFLATRNQVDRTGEAGLDVKWGVRPTLTADFTVNTDFAQVEADTEQVNLTRFPLFFPEKRPFFLENASIFQLGAPQQIDLFFTRRIGLSSGGLPIGIIGGARLSGRVGGVNVGLLNIQTGEAFNDRTGEPIAPANNFSVVRLQREFGRSNAGGIFVGRLGVGDGAAVEDHNRAYGFDLNLQMTPNSRWLSFIARTDSVGGLGSDYAGRTQYQYARDPWEGSVGYSQVGERFNPEVGFLPRRGYRRPSAYLQYSLHPRRWPWIRRMWPHVAWNAEYGFDGRLQSSSGHWTPVEITLRDGTGVGWYFNTFQDQPIRPFQVYQDASGRRVVIAPDLYSWRQHNFHYSSNPSAPLFGGLTYTTGGFYDGDFDGWNGSVGGRVGSRFLARVGWTRQNVDLPGGRFRTDLVPATVSYSFTTLASVQALLQYNSQASTVSSNIRLAWLNRSGTGLFLVYNDRRDTSPLTPLEALGRSFIVKYTRLFDF